jgi:hypothetical protein
VVLLLGSLAAAPSALSMVRLIEVLLSLVLQQWVHDHAEPWGNPQRGVLWIDTCSMLQAVDPAAAHSSASQSVSFLDQVSLHAYPHTYMSRQMEQLHLRGG